jgi:hypothetical protein
MTHHPRGVERPARAQLGGESMSNRTRITTFGALVLWVLSPAAAIAGIHTWDVGEVFSNADGTIQFVEFVEAGGGNFETGIANGSTSSNAIPKSFSWSGAPVTNTANKRYLVGSQTFANLTGAPPVDAIMPLSVLPFFFQPASDTVNFGPYDSCPFTAVPTNGIGSRDCVANTNQTSNSPTNYAGTPGSVIASLAPGLLDNFSNGTLQNWSGGGTNQASGGPAGAGDRYLEFTAVVSPLSVFNESQWAGNAIASGASTIDVDLNNIGPGPLSVRVMLLTPGCELGGTACTAWTSAGAVPLPSGSGWASVSFSIQEADLIRVLGSDSYAASLANVERVLIRHDDGPADPPDITPPASSTLGIDNIELPEPSGLLGLLAGVALVHLFSRRR